jgi:hypothetical protein
MLGSHFHCSSWRRIWGIAVVVNIARCYRVYSKEGSEIERSPGPIAFGPSIKDINSGLGDKIDAPIVVIMVEVTGRTRIETYPEIRVVFFDHSNEGDFFY